MDRGAARGADRELDAATNADPLYSRLHTSGRSPTVAAADTTPGRDDLSGNTSWGFYRWHAVRVTLVQAAESPVLS